MTFWPLFAAVGRSGLGVLERKYTSLFAATETVHVLALSVVGGVVLAVTLAAVRRSALSSGTLAHALRPWLVGALATVATTGLALVAAGPLKYYTNPVFPWKMGLLIAALAAYALFERRASAASARELPLAWRAWALATLIVWGSVAVAGRAIGLI